MKLGLIMLAAGNGLGVISFCIPLKENQCTDIFFRNL